MAVRLYPRYEILRFSESCFGSNVHERNICSNVALGQMKMSKGGKSDITVHTNEEDGCLCRRFRYGWKLGSQVKVTTFAGGTNDAETGRMTKSIRAHIRNFNNSTTSAPNDMVVGLYSVAKSGHHVAGCCGRSFLFVGSSQAGVKQVRLPTYHRSGR